MQSYRNLHESEYINRQHKYATALQLAASIHEQIMEEQNQKL